MASQGRLPGDLAVLPPIPLPTPRGLVAILYLLPGASLIHGGQGVLLAPQTQQDPGGHPVTAQTSLLTPTIHCPEHLF